MIPFLYSKVFKQQRPPSFDLSGHLRNRSGWVLTLYKWIESMRLKGGCRVIAVGLVARAAGSRWENSIFGP